MKSKYGDAVVRYIIEYHHGKSDIQLANEIVEKFNIPIQAINVQRIKQNQKKRHGVIFEPAVNNHSTGHIPWNKGTKGVCKSNSGTFKKGHPCNHTSVIGTEVIHSRSTLDDDVKYIYVKVGNTGSKKERWRPKQRVVWEQHNGPIPDGYKVTFADGNIRNFDINNLILVSRRESFLMNKHGLRFNNAELTKTGALIAKVMSVASEKGRERNDNNQNIKR